MTHDEYIRKATLADLPVMLATVACARIGLANRNVPQWQNGEGPREDVLRQDIADGRAYVLIVPPREQTPPVVTNPPLGAVLQQSCIGAMGSLTFTLDESYERLDTWPPYAVSPYAAIHRVTVNPRFSGRGYGTLIIQLLTSVCSVLGFSDVRIDTHPLNAVMRKTVERAGYVLKGDILLPVPDGERVAYQRVLSHRGASAHL